MKKILFVSGLIFLGTVAAFAQEQQMNATQAPQNRVTLRKAERNSMSPEQRAEFQTKRLDKTVTLTEEQKARVKAVYLKEAQQNQDRVALRQSTQKEIKSILTTDQNQILEAANKEKMAKMRERRALHRSELKAAPVQKASETATGE